MEKEEIISSGLLELYAAGIASEEEARQVEQWAVQYPEVAAELQKIGSSLETYARAYAIMPAPAVKEKLLTQITGSSLQNGLSSTRDAGTQTRQPSFNIRSFWTIAAAASVLLLIGSIALNIVTYNKFIQADRRLASSRQSIALLEEKNREMEAGMDVVQSKYSVPVALNGLAPAPDAAAKIFWMKNTGEVFVDPSNLPAAPEGKQYQLWGIVDGKPVSGGMIVTAKTGERYRIQKMKSFGKVDAFAISLEAGKENTAPQGPIYVMGKM